MVYNYYGDNMLPEVCSDGNVLRSLMIIKISFNIIRIIIPIMLIILIIIDYGKATTSSEEGILRKVGQTAVKRIIAGLVVVLMPSIFYGIFTTLGKDTSNISSCLSYATSENITKVFYDKAITSINQAEETLEYADYLTAKASALNVTDSDKSKELNEELTKLHGYLNLTYSIDSVTDEKTYNSIKTSIDKIDNTTIKTKLTNRLEETYKTNSTAKNTTSTSEPIFPNAGETIIKQKETDTMKVSISKVNSYYITRVWVKDPYSQLHKYDSPEYGKNLYKPGDLLAKTSEAAANKLLVGFNASGFYLANTYDASSVAKYSAYNKTSVGTLVITNGKVVRNVPNKAYKTWFITGVDKSGKLKIYTDSKASGSNEISAKEDWASNVISSGIKNTFTFASPLVIDGVASNITTSMPSASASLNRQAICQIDKNNFALITGGSLNRQSLINIMLSLNCQTGTNLDGGGSIALLYKSKNSNKIETIIGNGRSLTEVGYFSEE